MIDDRMVVAKVVTELGVRELRDKGDIKVRSDNSRITLLGEVDSDSTKRAVEQAAMSVPEVLGVDNQLSVSA